MVVKDAIHGQLKEGALFRSSERKIKIVSVGRRASNYCPAFSVLNTCKMVQLESLIMKWWMSIPEMLFSMKQ